eukprot:366517-Chlamydomonas_euryale.AAC.9
MTCALTCKLALHSTRRPDAEELPRRRTHTHACTHARTHAFSLTHHTYEAAVAPLPQHTRLKVTHKRGISVCAARRPQRGQKRSLTRKPHIHCALLWLLCSRSRSRSGAVLQAADV